MDRTALGPLVVSEPEWSRRIRVHQAWYRVAVLKQRDYGVTRPPGQRPLGSILTVEASARRLNFVSEDASATFDDRRTEGWGLDPVRTLQYLTSSQALTINLLAPVAEDRGWSRNLFGAVLGCTVLSMQSIRFEYFATYPSSVLGDRTTVDALVVCATPEGPRVLAIETKLSDRFNSRQVKLGDRYLRSLQLWSDGVLPLAPSLNQLVRVHTLADHIATSIQSSSPPTMALIHHELDPGARDIARDYREVLAPPTTFVSATLGEFLDLLATTCETSSQAKLVARLQRRYGQLKESESVWQAFQEERASR